MESQIDDKGKIPKKERKRREKNILEWVKVPGLENQIDDKGKIPKKKKSNSFGWLKVPGENSAQIGDFDNLVGG